MFSANAENKQKQKIDNKFQFSKTEQSRKRGKAEKEENKRKTNGKAEGKAKGKAKGKSKGTEEKNWNWQSVVKTKAEPANFRHQLGIIAFANERTC